MAVEQSVGISIASPSPNRVKCTGNQAVDSPVSESGNGVNCHQCRQKTRDFAAACKNQRKNKPCLVKLCSKCLLNRYGEKVEEVASFEEWICPKCRGICNCSVCMKRRGHQPTGVLINTAKATGFSSVSEMLLKSAERLNHENEVVFSARKKGKENSFDGQLGAHLPKSVGKKAKKVKGALNINADDNTTSEICDQKGTRDSNKHAGVSSCETDSYMWEKKPKKMKHCSSAETSNIIHKENALPLGTDLTCLAGIYVPAEDVGNALEFLEFCSVFGKILEMKSGEAEYVLQDILHGGSGKRGKLCPIVLLHMHLLSILKTERGEKCEKLSPANAKNSWFDVLKKCLAESQCVLKALGVDSLEEATDYEALNASEKLRVLNLLCIEILGTKKLRNWMEDQNTQFERKAKEAKQNVLESKAMPLKIDQKAHDIRIEPVLMDCRGHIYWKLNCADESDVLRQYVGKGDTLTLNEKWFDLSAEEKEVLEKNISTRLWQIPENTIVQRINKMDAGTCESLRWMGRNISHRNRHESHRRRE